MAVVMRALRGRSAETPVPGPFVPDDPVVMYEGTQVVALADRRSNDIVRRAALGSANRPALGQRHAPRDRPHRAHRRDAVKRA